jgi:hypothetical protein
MIPVDVIQIIIGYNLSVINKKENKMIGITQTQMKELQNGNIPEDLHPGLQNDISSMINQSGEAIISFHPTSYCVFAVVVETENFNDDEMEDFRCEHYAVVKSQD